MTCRLIRNREYDSYLEDLNRIAVARGVALNTYYGLHWGDGKGIELGGQAARQLY
jgi:hypothetical protein